MYRGAKKFATHLSVSKSVSRRSVIHFLSVNGISDQHLLMKRGEGNGENVIGLRAVREWTKRFGDGILDLGDLDQH
jgi:hypothetical protein